MRVVSMVGRADELDELARAWSRITSPGSGAVRPVVITGPAGIGKSLLVATALERFQPPPRILIGAARLHSPAPYDWLAAVLSRHDPAVLAPDGAEPVPADALAWLAQHPDAPKGERYAPGALLRLAVRTVRALVGAGPVAMVVEDLHALDPASLNLICELAAAPELPALLLVTSRSPEGAVSPQLAARTLARLSGMPGAIRQHLAPLTPDDVAEILTQVYPDTGLPAELPSALRDRTGGNPYWLTELLATGRRTAPEELVDQPLPGHLKLTADVSPAELTARELEVLSCLAAGMSNRQVASWLGISVRTVTVHVSNLLRKTRSASRTEAALWAVEHQLTSPGRPV